MPRRPRVFVENGFYHLMLRGNDRAALFRDECDTLTFQSLAVEALERHGCQLHGYCWMTNHIHAIVRVSVRPLGQYVRWLATEYARRFNRRYARTGHVFERRHRAILVNSDEQLLALIRYVHLNPVAARVVSDPAMYSWSSHRAYLRRDEQPNWLRTDFILNMLSGDGSRAHLLYANLFSPDTDCVDPSLGRAHFAEDAPHSDGKAHDASNKRLLAYFLGDLGIDAQLLTQITAPGRTREHARLRASISARAIEDDIATLTELAAYFGRSVATMSRALARYQRDHPDR